jgi:hypothetical protein
MLDFSITPSARAFSRAVLRRQVVLPKSGLFWLSECLTSGLWSCGVAPILLSLATLFSEALNFCPRVRGALRIQRLSFRSNSYRKNRIFGENRALATDSRSIPVRMVYLTPLYSMEVSLDLNRGPSKFRYCEALAI